MKLTVNLVYYDKGSFFDVYPKISKSLALMRSKIIGVQGIKWGWHVVLTYRADIRENIIKFGGVSGAELLSFLNKTKTITSKNRKYFWKYEEGTKGGKPHFHLYFDFKAKINKELLAKKIFKQKWDNGLIDLSKVVNDLRKKTKKSKDRGDIDLLMGHLLWKKWNKKGYAHAREMKGLGKDHMFNLLYYVNKDLMKPSTYNCLKKGAGHWGFGKGYKFKEVPLHSFSKMVSVKYAIHKMMTTKQNFIDYYDSIGMNGYKLFFSKIRKMQQGKYFVTIK